MSLIYKFILIRLKIIKNMVIELIKKYPIMLFVILFSIIGISFGIVYYFKYISENLETSLAIAFITNELTKTYLNVYINFLSMGIIIIILMKLALNLKKRVPDILLVNAYKPEKIKSLYDISSKIIIILFLSLFVGYITLKTYYLMTNDYLNTTLLFITTTLFLVSIIFFTLSFIITIKYVLIYVLRISDENLLNSILSIIIMFTILFLVILSTKTSFSKFLISQYIVNLYTALNHNNLLDIIVIIILSVSYLIVSLLLFSYTNKYFSIKEDGFINQRPYSFLPLNNKKISVYDKIIVKSFIRNIASFLEIISILVIVVIVSIIFGKNGQNITFAYSILLLINITVIFETALYIFDFNDNEIADTILIVNGNIKRFIISLNLFYFVLFFISYSIIIFIESSLLNINNVNILDTPLVLLPIVILLSSILKIVFITSNSSFSDKILILLLYGLVFSAVFYIINKINYFVTSNFSGISDNLSNITLILIFSVLLYMLQLKLFKYKLELNK